MSASTIICASSSQLIRGSQSNFSLGDDRETIAHAERGVIEGATHGMHNEKPTEVAEAVREFLERVWA